MSSVSIKVCEYKSQFHHLNQLTLKIRLFKVLFADQRWSSSNHKWSMSMLIKYHIFWPHPSIFLGVGVFLVHAPAHPYVLKMAATHTDVLEHA